MEAKYSHLRRSYSCIICFLEYSSVVPVSQEEEKTDERYREMLN